MAGNPQRLPRGCRPRSPTRGQGGDPWPQPGASRGGLQFLVSGSRTGQPKVATDSGIEQVQVLRADCEEIKHVDGISQQTVAWLIPLQYAVLAGVGLSAILYIVLQSNQVTIKR
jgi:hypothetical protein